MDIEASIKKKIAWIFFKEVKKQNFSRLVEAIR